MADSRGIEAFKRRLLKVPDAVRAKTNAAIRENAAEWVTWARKLAPKDPEDGTPLHDSIRHYESDTGGQIVRAGGEAGSRGILDLIGYAEGTDKGRGYNESLGYGAYTGGNKNLVLMSLDDIDALQTSMLQHPDNKFNSSALGRYQIVQKTLRGLRGKLGLDGSEQFDAAMQDRLAQELLRQRGNDPSGLRNEWEGLRRVDDSTIRQAYDGTSVSMPALDSGITAKNQALADQQKAYEDIVSGAEKYIATQNTEISALGMSAQAAAKLRYEQQLLNEAEARGIELTPERVARLKEVAAGMAMVEESAKRAARTQEDFAEAQGFLSDQIGDGLIDVIMNAKSAEDALAGLGKALARAALEATLMGKGPLAGIFGTATGGGLLGLFGFDEGGYTGPGGKKQPAGVVHKGEVVFSQADVKRHGGPAAVDALRRGMPGYADGGVVGANMPNLNMVRIPQPSRQAANDNMKIIVGVSADNNGNLMPFVESVTRENIRGAAPQIIKSSVQQSHKTIKRALPSMMGEAQARNF